MLEVHVVTIFPSFFRSPLQESLIKRAQQNGKVSFTLHDLRDYTEDRHRTVDDKPFGGGAGMLLMPEPVFRCVENIQPRGWVVSMDPHGEPLNQKKAARLAEKKKLVILAGHYEGMDHRIREHLVDEEVSIGDFVTMGGEAPALCLIESVVRLLPGVVGNSSSVQDESFQSGQLEYPQYTRPRVFRGWEVPEVLVSGDHRKVEKWRRSQALEWTRRVRPDLLESGHGRQRHDTRPANE